MADLFGILNSLGIEPIGARDIDLTDIVQNREVGQIVSDQDLAPALVQADLDIVPIIPEPEPVETDANPPSLSSALKVGLRDSVRFCFVDSPDDDAFVTIVDSESNPDLGLLNKNTVVGRALLDAAVVQEREVALPMGKRRLRVLEILAASLR